jgi:hypothetical protein
MVGRLGGLVAAWATLSISRRCRLLRMQEPRIVDTFKNVGETQILDRIAVGL